MLHHRELRRRPQVGLLPRPRYETPPATRWTHRAPSPAPGRVPTRFRHRQCPPVTHFPWERHDAGGGPAGPWWRHCPFLVDTAFLLRPCPPRPRHGLGNKIPPTSVPAVTESTQNVPVLGSGDSPTRHFHLTGRLPPGSSVHRRREENRRPPKAALESPRALPAPVAPSFAKMWMGSGGPRQCCTLMTQPARARLTGWGQRVTRTRGVT